MAKPSGRGNNLDSVRKHNLSTVLGIAHRLGPVSRSDLTRETGLNRSTVAALVAELGELGLIVESEPDSGVRAVGRPSPIVAPDPSVAAIAVVVEIDAVTLGLVGLDGQVRRRLRKPVDRVPTARESVDLAASAIDELVIGTGARVVALGAAIPGQVRRADGVVRTAPHLGWVDEPVAEMLQQATGLPVHAANDAQLGAVAEHLFGSGRGVEDLVYVNGGSSGIGGGIVAGGQLFGGGAGFAGEVGHLRTSSGGGTDWAGLPGTFEAEATRPALQALLGLTRAAPDEFEAALAAGAERPEVRAEIERQLEIIGIAVGSAATLLNPSLIVLGGYLGAVYGLGAERVEQAIAAHTLPVCLEGLRITRTALGEDLLLIGAAELAFAELLDDPAGAAR